MSYISTIEQDKLHLSWLACNKIHSQEFLDGFKSLWNSTLEDVEALFQKCNVICNICDVRKVGITLQPDIAFTFSPLMNAYFLNVWSFFFCPDLIERSLYFRQSFSFAHMLLHEHAHYEFWRDHKMLDANREEKQQFAIKYGVECEKYAYSQEIQFLKQLRNIVPILVDVDLFRVTSWGSNGCPYFKIKPTKLCVKKTVKMRLKDIREIKRKLIVDMGSYTNEVTKHNTENHKFFSSVLKLDCQSIKFPVVEIDCL